MDKSKLIELLEIYVKSPIHLAIMEYKQQESASHLKAVCMPLDTSKPLDAQVVDQEYQKGFAAGLAADTAVGLLNQLKAEEQPTGASKS